MSLAAMFTHCIYLQNTDKTLSADTMTRHQVFTFVKITDLHSTRSDSNLTDDLPLSA